MKFIRLIRIKQWSKNLLVVAAPAAAGNVLREGEALKTAAAFFCFCLISAAGYAINDLRDIEQDRRNPKKATRPIVTGEISKTSAWITAGILVISGFSLATFLPQAFVLSLTAYFFFTLSYSLYFKHEPVIELLIVSFGFTLRAIAGAAATQTPTSIWFLMVSTFAPLVILTSKRISEAMNVPFENLRPVMKKYSPEFLQFVLTLAAGVTITSYGLWAFSLTESHPYAQFSVVTVTLQLFRYVWIAESGRGEVPEELFFKDYISLISMVITGILLTLSIYAH
jgi:decaprenyl-phosphate phosphoribosyltransferase